MTVEEYRLSLGWSVSELARRAGLTTKTINMITRLEQSLELLVKLSAELSLYVI